MIITTYYIGKRTDDELFYVMKQQFDPETQKTWHEQAAGPFVTKRAAKEVAERWQEHA